MTRTARVGGAGGRSQTITEVRDRAAAPLGVGESAVRPDAPLKVLGRFAFASDLYLDGMLWGATVRSPHPRARILSIDVSEALKIRGVATVLTAADVPGENLYGIKKADQPVLADREVRYAGEGRWRWRPPTIPRPPAGPWRRCGSNTRC